MAIGVLALLAMPIAWGVDSTAQATNSRSATRPAVIRHRGDDGFPFIKLKMPTHKRLPIPPESEVQRDNNQLRVDFQHQYPLDTNRAEYLFYSGLYRHYVEQERGSQHPAMRYAAMMAIVRLATLQLDPRTLFPTIVAIGNKYKVNKYRLMARAAERMLGEGQMRMWMATAFAHNLTQYTRKAMSSMHFISAERMARVGVTVAMRYRQQQYLKSLVPMLAKAQTAAPLCAMYRHAVHRLKTHPLDTQANATVGLFLSCFSSHTTRANEHLLKSGDPKLVNIAHAAQKTLDEGELDESAVMDLANSWLRIAKDHNYRPFRQPLRNLAQQTASTTLATIDDAVLSALHKDHYHRAVKLLQDAIQIVSELHMADFAGQVPTWEATTKSLKQHRSAYRHAVKAVNQGDNNARLDQAIGEYLCFVSGHWKRGLPYLRRSPVGRVQEAAANDAQQPTDPLAQKALGDMWWSIAKTYHGVERYNIRARAVKWYNRSRKKLHGSALTEVIYRALAFKHAQF